MKLSILILLFIFTVQGSLSLKCYNCTSVDNTIRITPPLFQSYFFYLSNTRCSDATVVDCKSFCISQYIREKGYRKDGKETSDKTLLFRACADDVVVGVDSMYHNTQCSGLIYGNKGYFESKFDEVDYYEYGNGIACTSDLCNNQTEDFLSNHVEQTCDPCKHMGPNCHNCITIDGYTAQCNCDETGKKPSCPKHQPEPLTTSSTTTSTTTTTATSTSSTSTTTTTTSTTSQTTTSATTTTVTSSTTTTTSVTTTSLAPTISPGSGKQKGIIALMVIYTIFVVLLVILIFLIVIYRRERDVIINTDNIEMQ